MRVIKTMALAATALGLVATAPAIAHTFPHAAKPVDFAADSAPTPHGGRHRAGWTWPLAVPKNAPRPTIVRGFEPPAQRWESGHRGVDLLAEPGQEVFAAGAGTVSFAGVLFGRLVVAIDHTAPGRDTLRTTYEPVDPAVKVGDRVRVGELIGHIEKDTTASHCAPRACLHWGLVRGFGHAERYLDPSVLLMRGPVRLLPVWGFR